MPETGSIVGKILNQINGQPLEGASLKLTGGGVSKHASSGINGGFHLDDLTSGKYDLLATKLGFQDRIYGPLFVVAGSATDISIALQPRFE